MTTDYAAAILVASDKASTGVRPDATGPALSALLEEHGYRVASVTVVPDDRATLSQTMLRLCREDRIALLVTSGGTGLSPRDCTPEATMDIAERLVPGIGEAMRAASLAITPRAMLSRGIAAVVGRTLIVNLPGSPKGACENLAVVLPALEHGLDILTGRDSECARHEEKHP